MWKIIIFLLYLLILSKYDYREKQVPSVLIYVGAGCTFLSVMWEWLAEGVNSGQALGMLPGLLLIVLAAVTGKAGIADGVVLLIAGAVIGYPNILFAFCISLLLFCVVSVVLLCLRKIKLHENLPYLPFLTVAVVIGELI